MARCVLCKLALPSDLRRSSSLTQNPALEGSLFDPLMAVLSKYRSSADLHKSIDQVGGIQDLDDAIDEKSAESELRIVAV